LATYRPLGIDILDCDTSDMRPGFISSDAADKMAEEPFWLREDLVKVGRTALENPLTVFHGLNRPGLNDDEYCCYCGPAEHAPQPGVLVIFVREPGPSDLIGPVVFWWEWREEDPGHPGRPISWQSDFGSVKYDRNGT